VAEAPGRASRLEAWLIGVTQYPRVTLAACCALAAASAVAAASLLGVNSDPIAMLDEDLPFRQTDVQLREAFPGLDDNLLAVIEAPTPEQANLATRRLTDRLDGLAPVEDWRWAAGSAFFAENGLLFLATEELERLADRLTSAQPLLGRLARRTDAVTLLELLTQIAERDAADAAGLDIDRLHGRIAEVLSATISGQPAMLSWQRLLGDDGNTTPAREVVLVDPVLDHGKVLAGREVMQALDRLRGDLGLDSGPVRMKLTGSTALRHEEMKSVIEGAGLTGLLALGLVSAVMLTGLRSLPLSLIALANLALGLLMTAGFAAVAIGRVNLISVSFVVLYIGLGVNYAVHYLLRYREIAQAEPGTDVAAARAAISAGRFLKRPLLLSALTTALGFFAFVPTAFSGVAQLGLIAGVAMGITLTLSYTALPAMLALFRPHVRTPAPDPSAGWRRGLEWPLRHRRPVLALGGLLALAALPAIPALHFDADPLNVRDPESESVTTIRQLLADGDAGYRNIQVLLAPDTDAEPLRRRLADLPAVDRAMTLGSFVPEDQDFKLQLIEDLGWVLGPDIVGANWSLAPIEPDALGSAAIDLARALDPVHGQGTKRLKQTLGELTTALEADTAAGTAREVNRALAGGLAPALGRLSAGLGVSGPVTRAGLPDWLVEQWRGAGGEQLIQVFPAGDALDPNARRAFTEQVLAVAGDRATGGPVIQLAAGDAITRAFRQAMAWAVIGIAAVLLLTLGSIADAARVMAPLALGGLLTLGAMVMLGIPFNFANVVALPLLLGVAVDNGIHLVSRRRAGLLPDGNVLKTATARAIVVGALITAGGFGNLAFSPHTGTASLGVILAVGLALMVVATLVFLPALLGREEQA